MTSNSTDENKDESQDAQEIDPKCKVFVSRIPSNFTEDSIRRLLESQIGEGSVVDVGLKYEEQEVEDSSPDGKEKDRRSQRSRKPTKEEHKGYAFTQFQTPDQAASAVDIGKIRGGKKEKSTKMHTLYIRAAKTEEEEENAKHVCFLWQNFRCPYGENCKFAHEGDGGCLVKKEKNGADKKKRKKCWDYKKGKCKLGDECPFSHDFEEKPKSSGDTRVERPKSEKDCINWKTKGKCRKGDRCPYRHDEDIRQKVLQKLEKKNGKAEAETQGTYKRQQPLSVRVFGLNYDTKEEDVRSFFANCGKINQITFPAFEDSGRSKGYCEVLFASPKAVAAAVKLNETELHGRWLSIQAGKMYLRQWESHGQAETGSNKRQRHRR